MFQRNSTSGKWDTPYLVLGIKDKKGNITEKVIPQKAMDYLNKGKKKDENRRVPANTVLYTYVKSGPVALQNKLARRDAPILSAFFSTCGMPDDTLIGLKYLDGIACWLTVGAIKAICDQVKDVDAIMTEAEKKSLDLGKAKPQPAAFRHAGMDEKATKGAKDDGADEADEAIDWAAILSA